MKSMKTLIALGLCGILPLGMILGQAAAKPATSADVLGASTAADWRPLDPGNTLYVELPAGRVIIELCSAFAPNHVANVKTLAREHYWDGLAVIRVQDNYVAQWGDPNGDDERTRRPLKSAKAALAPEFDRGLDKAPLFTRLPDGDVYAPEVGFYDGFPVARDQKQGRMWLIHTYGMVGAGRGNTADSGSGAEIYVVIGHAPRLLDRNVTLFGRVIRGIELLSALPRGTGAMGFHEKPEQHVPIRTIRLASEVAEAERTPLELLRTDTPLFQRFIEARRNRVEEWFLYKAGHIEIANIPIPVRPPQQPAAR
jgi:peptidylprolyl isomerase